MTPLFRSLERRAQAITFQLVDLLIQSTPREVAANSSRHAPSPIPRPQRCKLLEFANALVPVQGGRIESCAGTHRSGTPNYPVSRGSSA